VWFVPSKVADRIANALYAYGFRHAYGIHGANSEDLFAALLRQPEVAMRHAGRPVMRVEPSAIAPAPNSCLAIVTVR